MDPYLERTSLWHGVHNRLIASLADLLGPLLRPRYFVAVEEYSYLADPMAIGFATVPDVGVVGPYSSSAQPAASKGTEPGTLVMEPQIIELPMPERIRQTFLEILEVDRENTTELWLRSSSDGMKVVTLLEILSPWSKAGQDGRVQYERKRQHVLNSYTNLVEIDLLRAGQRMVRATNADYHYSIVVSPSSLRPRAQFYPFTVRQAIPAFRLPLQEDDAWPVVDLNSLLHELYDRAAYELRINYRSEPVPPFAGEDVKWVDALLHKAGLR
jgi:hypothetical protein